MSSLLPAAAAAAASAEEEEYYTNYEIHELVSRLSYTTYLALAQHVTDLKVDKIREGFREARRWYNSGGGGSGGNDVEMTANVFLPRLGVTVGQFCFFKLVLQQQ